MPHCVIEYSVETPTKPLMKTVYDSTLASGLFDPSGKDIKVRAMPYTYQQNGAGLAGFIHVTLKILSGRTTEQKRHLSTTVLTALHDLGFTNCSLTVEVIDIDRDSYAKLIV